MKRPTLAVTDETRADGPYIKLTPQDGDFDQTPVYNELKTIIDNLELPPEGVFLNELGLPQFPADEGRTYTSILVPVIKYPVFHDELRKLGYRLGS